MTLKKFFKPTVLKMGCFAVIFLILFLLMPILKAQYPEECWVKDSAYIYDVYKFDKNAPECSISKYECSFFYGWTLLFPGPPMETVRAVMVWEVPHILTWSVAAMLILSAIISYLISCILINCFYIIKKA